MLIQNERNSTTFIAVFQQNHLLRRQAVTILISWALFAYPYTVDEIREA
jgi:hypothetical protein